MSSRQVAVKNDESLPGWHIRAVSEIGVDLAHRGPFKTEMQAKRAVAPFARKLSKTRSVAYVVIVRRPLPAALSTLKRRMFVGEVP